VYQEFAATGGAKTFVMHLRRESADANLPEVRMLVEWCDAERNIVQATQKIFTNPAQDSLWHQLYVSSVYTGSSPATFVRPRFFARFGAPFGGANAVTFDDAAFYDGGYTSRLRNASFEDASQGNWTDWAIQSSGAAPWYQNWNPHDGSQIMAFPCWETNGDTILYQSVQVAPTGTSTFAAWFNRESRFGFSNVVMQARWFNADLQCVYTNTLNVVPGIQDWEEMFLHVNCPPLATDTNLHEVLLSTRIVWGLRTGDNLAMLLDDFRFVDGAYAPSYPVTSLQDPGFETPSGATSWSGSPWTGIGSLSREDWAYRRGARGVAFQSWAAGQALLYQTVATTGGTWTFSGWFKKNIHAVASNTWLMLEWGGPGGSLVQVDLESLDDIPADGMAHHVYVTGTCSSQGVAFVRPKIWYKFAAPVTNNNEVTYFDDAELYSGSYTGAGPFANGGFDTPGEANYWDIVPGGYAFIHNWGNQSRSGTNGLVFTGWQTLPTYQRESRVSQTAVGGPGTYTFTVWLKAQLDVNLTNVALRIHWLDKDAQPVQAMTEKVLSVPRDDIWHAYAVTATCSSASLHEVIPVVAAGWIQAAGEVSFLAEDFSLTSGSIPEEDSDNDGLPDAWEIEHFGNITTSAGPGDNDNDGWSDMDEYIASTSPTNSGSAFNIVDNAVTNVRVIIITVGPPTTNSRVYDVYWNTNLASANAWAGYGLDRTGRADGGAIQMVVTNTAGLRFYRGGVKLP
jgi:hypothetical protein